MALVVEVMRIWTLGREEIEHGRDLLPRWCGLGHRRDSWRVCHCERNEDWRRCRFLREFWGGTVDLH